MIGLCIKNLGKYLCTEKAEMNKQNEVSQGFLKGSDLAKHEKEVLEDASKKVGFIFDALVGKSTWWGSSGVGAFHYKGTYKGMKAVLKIQGVKPNTSESVMISSFSKTNESKVVRPPHLYAYLPWDEKKKYEALVMEFIDGKKLIQIPTTDGQVSRFFEIFRDYRKNCRDNPWVEKPKTTISESIVERFARWREMSFKIYPDHPLRKKGDRDLTDAAVMKLAKEYEGIQPEFVHGHLSDNDLYRVEKDVVVLSNLYWSWRAPFYDAVFAYHWFIYHLSDVKGITPKEIEEQRNIWLKQINSLPDTRSRKGKWLLKLALLERSAAGLNLDALSIDRSKPISAYLLEATREQIKKLLK